MRVLTITNLWPTASRPWYGIFVERQVRFLESTSVCVEVIAISGSGSPLRSLPAYLRAAVKVLRLNFGRRRYDVVHAHTGHCGMLALLQLRYPVVQSYVGYDVDVADRPDNARTIAERWLFRGLSIFMAATIVQSSREKGRLSPAARRRNTVVPYGVDRAMFKPIDRALARRQLGSDDQSPWALFPADPDRYQKRFELAAAAVEEAHRTHPELELKVEHGLEPRLIPIWMNAADLLVMSSRAEGSPNVVKEAMACDLPVVAVDVGDVAEIMSGTRHCHICECEAEPMGRAIVEVVEALPERSNGRERSANLGLEEIALRVRAVYEQAVCRGPGPFGFLRLR